MAAWLAVTADPDAADAAVILEAAEAGSPRAQLLASHMALEGRGQTMDAAAARAWLDKACAQDFAPALVQLGAKQADDDSFAVHVISIFIKFIFLDR